jgi:hypothetical protein
MPGWIRTKMLRRLNINTCVSISVLMIIDCALIFVYGDKLIPKHGTRYRMRIKILRCYLRKIIHILIKFKEQIWILRKTAEYMLIIHVNWLFQACWLFDAPTGLTFKNCNAFCPQCIDVYCFISEQTVTFPDIINWLVFITEMKSVYCAVRTGPLNKPACASSLNG